MATLILILEIAALLLAIKIAFWLLYACVVGTIYLISQSDIPQFFRGTLYAINLWITYDIPEFFQNALDSLSVAGNWLVTTAGWLLSKINFSHKTPQPDNAPQADEDQANGDIPITEGYQELLGDNWVTRRSERQHHAHHHTMSNNTLHTITRDARLIDNRKLYFIGQDGTVHDAVKTNSQRPK